MSDVVISLNIDNLKQQLGIKGKCNAKEYGVKGDGLTDDTIAIQKAVDENGEMLFFEAGVYIISDTIRITTNNFDLLGEYGTIWRRMRSPNHMLEIHSERCRVSNIEFDGNRKEFTEPVVQGYKQVTFSNLYITGDNNTFDRIKVCNSGSHGLCFDGQKFDPNLHKMSCSWNEINSCEICYNEEIGISHNKGINNRIVNNYVHNNGWEGLTIDHYSDQVVVDHNRLHANMSKDTNSKGGVGQVGLDAITNCILSNNIITSGDPHRAAPTICFQNNLGPSTHNIISANVFSGSPGWGLLLKNNTQGWVDKGVSKACHHNIITNNIFKECAMGQVSIEWGCTNNVYDNNITDGKNFAIANGVFYEPSVNNEPNFIIALTGQSNSQGFGGQFEEGNPADQPHARIRGWNHIALEWQEADMRTDSLGSTSHRPKNHQSLAFHFAKRLVNKYPDIIVGIINYGLSGAPIRYWNEEEDGTIYKVHKYIIEKALSKLEYKRNIDVICYHQGESDWNMDTAYYEDTLNKVIKQYRSLDACNHETPFIVGQTTQANNYFEMQNETLLNLNIDDDKYTECVDTGDLQTATYQGQPDPYHFSAQGHRTLGLRYYKAFCKMFK